MASSNLESQLQSAQKNILFLQQEHANTLKGLHAEIRRLQQHCTDLTYELTMKTSDQAENAESRTSELRKKYSELEVQLKTKEGENSELIKELQQKNAMITVLENTIKEREKKYLEELKVKSHKLSMLSNELEQRASTIAYLTSQLHATKKKLVSSSSGTSDGTPSDSQAASSYKPSPPKEKLPDTPRRRMKKSLSTPLNSEIAEVYRLGSDGRKILLRESLDVMPDPAPFLLCRESAEALVIKEKPVVIPPILPERSPAKEKQHKMHIGVAHRIQHVASSAAQHEVETLAVDQVNDNKVVRKRTGTDRTV
ncbi:coiled-coil domain-containing protein 92 isoform X2 [Protopterus annectens]|uniref:coiled-coil domain-containing protein 92 isoform X2 n=1 Tax=Protopterus annectens TaxID=7888 RepID=UPI001CFB3F67|nr:coiled-coil domain-containing protein 92 isoform X2 [Protopterus annectens]